MRRGLILDFDGVILDTETPLHESWRLVFEQRGVAPIPLDRWATSMGRHDDDSLLIRPLDELAAALGQPVDADAVQGERRAIRDRLLSTEPVAVGLVELLEAAERLGTAVAIASSSPSDWVLRHLDERGIRDRFPVIVCAGDGLAGKPAPDVYLAAAAELGLDPGACLAVEDSPNGLAAAVRAGVPCIAVRTPLTRGLRFDLALQVVDDLREVDLDAFTTTPVIRRFVESDRAALIRLWQDCDLTRPWNHPSADIDRKLAVDPELLLVAEDDGSLVGSVMIGYEGHCGWINYLAACPDRRRAGLGRALMSAAERALLVRGCPKVNLQIRSENREVVAFYESIGYALEPVVSMGRRLLDDEPA